MKLTRREFIIGGAASMCVAGLGAALDRFAPQKPAPGSIRGANSATGHKLRGGGLPAPSKVLRKEVVIVGGGIAGLAAGYRLHKSGCRDFQLLELEHMVGGNSASGRNEVSAYPWGAHYVPLLTEEATEVRQLFEELGVITGYDDAGRPLYNDYYLCADPHERLYRYGRWQDGLIPALGVGAEEEAQYKRFFDFMESLKNRKGSDGKRLFAIPVDKSSQDEEWLKLDEITMAEWMAREGYDSPHLCWYVNYCCRDDYGATMAETSAWAGLHYFASRNGTASNAEPGDVITWPEGNGWIASKLAEPLESRITTGALVHAVTDQGDHVTVDYWDQATHRSTRIIARTVVVATPRFVASRLMQSETRDFSTDGFSWSPWAVANVTLSKLPSGKGAPLSWDNVVYGSPLLGFVVATHQIPQMRPLKTVLTCYWPLSHLDPADARKEALRRSHAEWRQIFLKELLKVHPELDGHVEQVDVWVWGHAMIRPTRGFLWGDARKQALRQQPPIFTAHSDLSGISIFEEACTHGVRAAGQVLAYLGIPSRSQA
ncbi:MAG: FAD-dependent oxidoreductase [Chlorobaculum sp.]|nr:FAD-dependent oxidoreductase [Chlorobaculum sp.]